MATRGRSQSYKGSELILPSDRMLIVMVGLPARGKSYMAKKIYKYLRHLQLICKVFNCGSYRRIATKNTTVGKASANFFDPDNEEAVRIRRQCCIDAMHDVISWYNTGGQIAILDATNTTLKRRQLIREFFSNKKSELEYNVSILNIESICNDESIIHNNIISVKLKNPDYCTVDAQKAILDFKQRIKMYQKAYVEVGKDDGSFIKVINVGSEVSGYEINDYISCRIFYFLMHLHLHSQQKTPKKPLLMQLNNKSANKADKEKEDKYKKIAASVGAKFTRPAYDRPVHALAPWMRRSSFLMWSDPEDTYKNSIDSSPNKLLKEASDKTINEDNEEEEAKNSNITPIKSTTKPKIITNSGASSVMSPISSTTSPPVMMKHRPKVRKSTLLLKMLSVRDLQFINTDSVKKTKKAKKQTSVDSTSGYASDNEEDSDFVIEEEEEEEEKEKINDEEFSCELCGRTIPKSDANLVDSMQGDGNKVKICEICLYETDSEDDTTADEAGFIDAMHSAPISILQSQTQSMIVEEHQDVVRKQQLEDIQIKTEEMSHKIESLLDLVDDNNDQNKNKKNKNIKQELIKLQQKMQQLLD